MLKLSVKEKIKDIASERPTYRYREVWQVVETVGRGEPEDRQESTQGQQSEPSCSKNVGVRRKERNLFRPIAPDQLWEIDITYIPTESGMTHLMCIKGLFHQ